MPPVRVRANGRLCPHISGEQAMNNNPKTLMQADFDAIADFCYAKTSKLVRREGNLAPVIIAGTMDSGKVVIAYVTTAPVSDLEDKAALVAFLEFLISLPEV